MDNDILTTLGALLGTFGGVAGIISIFEIHMNFRNNRFHAIDEYLKGFEEPGFTAARAAAFKYKGMWNIDKDMATVVNYYHHWGILAKKHFLPLSVFKEGSSESVIRLYEKTEAYIKERREKGDKTYASGFTWLYITLKKNKLKKELREFKSSLS